LENRCAVGTSPAMTGASGREPVTMSKTYVVLGGGGSFGLHTSKYLLDHADPKKVIAVGRNLPKYECFTLGVGDGDPRYSYHAYHVNYELVRSLTWMAGTSPAMAQELCQGNFITP